MLGRKRVTRWLVAVGTTTLLSTSLVVVAPAATVRAADPPVYYAIALGLTSHVGGLNVMNEAGAIAGYLNDGRLARIVGSVITPIPGPAGSTNDINENGTIVGVRDSQAVRIDGTTVTTIAGTGGEFEIASDIDEAGTTIVGYSYASGVQQAWVSTGGPATPLDTLGGDNSVASRVTDTGLIAGTSQTASGDTRFVTWDDGVIADHGNLGGEYASVSGMNEAGQFIGGISLPGVGDRAVFWDGSTLVNLGTLGGSSSTASALNQAGTIVGYSTNASGHPRAFVSDGGGALDDLGTLGGSDAYGVGINDHGQIAGTSFTAAGRQHGFLIDDGVMYDINDLLPAGSVEIRSAAAISNSGHIIADGVAGPVLLVPGPRPAAAYSVIDLSVGLGSNVDVYPRDMNESRQATGWANDRAWRYDGTTSSRIFPGFPESYGYAINGSGSVAGTAEHGGDFDAFFYDGTVHFLGTFGGSSSDGQDINDVGDVVGGAMDAGGHYHAFLYRGGTMIDLHDLGGISSYATRVNESGIVIGAYSPSSGINRGFVSDGTTTTDLGTLGGASTSPQAINGAGEIVGTSSTATQPYHAFRYADGTITSVAPAGSISSEASSINEGGVIAGSYEEPSGDRRGYVFDDGNFTLIPAMGASFATTSDINDSGQVVGYSSGPDGTRGFLFDDGDVIDLTTQIPLGFDAAIGYVDTIANDGTILAGGHNAEGRDKSYLLIPTTPNPTPDPLTFDTSPAAPASVARLGRFDRTFQLSRTYGPDANDPAVIDVTGRFVAPSGATFTVPAYYGHDYTVQSGTGVGSSENYLEVPLTPPADGIWHVRFSPDEVGTWTYTLRARDHVTGQQTTVVSAQLSFAVTASAAKGQVERDPRDDLFLRYQDGSPYLPMGHNVAFQQGEPVNNDGEHYVEPLFASMEAAGQNWTRIWMTDFNRNALEWSSDHWAGWYDGVGQYAGQSAFRIERQLDVAEQHGLQVQLVLNDHGQVRSLPDGRWTENPYNAANGGPVAADHPEAFFTDPTARQLFKQRLRYLVARYGAYRNVLAWELFNEVQFVGSATANPGNSAQVRADIVAWHAEMAAYLRSIDPYHHLITTSSDIDSSLKDIWADPNIDLVQVHDYDPALTTRDVRFRGYVQSLNAAYHKPVIIGEFGIHQDPEIEFDPVAAAPLDDREAHLLQATHLHNAAWASAMSGSGAMSWWWGAYIHSSPSKHRTSPEFPANERVNPPLRDFFAGEDLAGMSLGYSDVTAPSSVVVLGLDNGSEGFAWIRDAQNEYGTGAGPGDVAGRTMSGISVGFDGFTDGTYRIEVHDPWGVQPMDDSRLATAVGGTLTVALPAFTRDIALKIRPAGPATPDQPVTATVTSPNGGPVTITQTTTPDPPPVGSGYTFLALQLDITAPAATPANPIVLVFTVDQALLQSADPDLTAATLAVFRNGTPVATCTSEAPATPNPCVSLRETLSGGDNAGDVRITVLTSAASRWNFGSNAAATVPGAPTGVVATKGDHQASVTWTAPADDGHSPLTGYTVTSSPGNRTATVDGSTTTATVTGLTNGTSYTFTVKARNVIGQGPASAPSNAVTPAALLSQTITFAKPANQTLLASPLTVSATASSGLTVTLTSTTTAVCTVSGFSITLLTAGTCSITATQPGDAVYKAANPVTRSFTVSQASQTITFAKPANQTLLASPLTVSATASSGLTVTLTSTTTAVCTVSGFSITLLTAGTCSITATQPGDAVYKAANPVTRSFTVSQASQTITFAKPANQTLLASPLTVSATASSGLTVTLTSTTTAVCTVSGFSITLLTAGTCSITATQPGDAVYKAANPVTRSFSVTKAPQTITIPDPGPQSMHAPTVTLNPSASSGLTVTLSTQSASVCTVSGNTVTLKHTGTCKIRGDQPGNAIYAPAPAVVRQFTVSP